MSFSKQVINFGRRSTQEVIRYRRGVALKLFGAVVMSTPVDTGRLRANWKFSAGKADLEATEETDKVGEKTIAKITAGTLVAAAKLGDPLFLANNLPYAERIEYDGWSHTKAPDGMLRKNFIRVSQLLRKKLAT
jgi:hypothetical protein